jgi:hypothetical protein
MIVRPIANIQNWLFYRFATGWDSGCCVYEQEGASHPEVSSDVSALSSGCSGSAPALLLLE